MGALLALLVLIFWGCLFFFFILVWWKIIKKTGYHPALAFLMLLPVANLIMLAILAFKEWPVYSQLKGADAAPAKSLSTPVIAIIVIAAILPIAALLAAIAIPNILLGRILANESLAQASLKTIASAAESYAAANNGQYPPNEYDLRYGTPIQLDKIYNNKNAQGYAYSSSLNSAGYRITATPAECGITGNKIFTIETKGEITEKSCR